MGILIACCGNARYARDHYLPPLRRAGWGGRTRFLVPGGPPPPAGLEGVAGLLLTGGPDIHPRRWEPPEAPNFWARPDEARDALEIPLVLAAWERGLPILAICRGEQVLNVALGGSLIQDVPEHFDCPRDQHQHGTAADPGDLHPVAVVAGTALAGLLGPGPVPVNSRHHQAAGRLAPGLRACALDPGTRKGEEVLVEALEALDPRRWVIGVQWHPEDLAGRDDPAGAASRSLFSAFAGRLGPRGARQGGSAIING